MNKFSKFTAPLRAAWAKLDAWTFGHAKHVAMAAGVAFVAYCVKRLFGLTMFGAGDDAAIEALKIPDIIPDLPVDSPSPTGGGWATSDRKRRVEAERVGRWGRQRLLLVP